MFQLIRHLETEHATYGSLVIPGGLRLCVLEPPWKNNQRDISCIPTGDYRLEYWDSPKFGWCWRIYTVPDRDPILWHTGNGPEHTKGCPLPGMGWHKRKSGIYVVHSSRLALNYLEERLAAQPSKYIPLRITKTF